VTPVRDRSQVKSEKTGKNIFCANSYAVASAEVLEAFYLKEKGQLIEFSIQHIMDCSSDQAAMKKSQL